MFTQAGQTKGRSAKGGGRAARLVRGKETGQRPGEDELPLNGLLLQGLKGKMEGKVAG